MKLGTIVVTSIASMQPWFSHRSWVGQIVWLGIALLLSFAAYHSSILLVNQWAGMHGLTADVLLWIFGSFGVVMLLFIKEHFYFFSPLPRSPLCHSIVSTEEPSSVNGGIEGSIRLIASRLFIRDFIEWKLRLKSQTLFWLPT